MRCPLLLLLVIVAVASAAQRDYPFTPVPLPAVEVGEGFWLPRMKTNREVTVAKLTAEHRAKLLGGVTVLTGQARSVRRAADGSPADEPARLRMIPYYAWCHRGTTEWGQYDFAKPQKVSSVEVYWFDDTGRGQCRIPKSWKLLYRHAGKWEPAKATTPFGTAKDKYNRVSFEPITTDALRLQVQLQPDFSGRILEWKVK